MRLNWLLIAGVAAGFIFSDFWRSRWNLLVPLGIMIVCYLIMAVRSRGRRERDSNSRGH